MGETPIIRVRLHRYPRRAIGLIWRCGRSGGEVSSGTRDNREAERAAGRLEEQLEQGNLPGRKESLSITWADFRERYELEWLERLSKGSKGNWEAAANHFETICKPRRLSDISKAMLSKYRAALEAKDLSETSAKSYYGALRASLGWAESMDLIGKVPTIRHRKTAKTSSIMRTRVITAEEFDRMLAAASKVRKKDAAAFVSFLRGLWLSSLRIDELKRLSWDNRAMLHVDLSGKLPLIVFLGAQKNRSDNYLPAPPEFWQMIDRPGVLRRGCVFPIPGKFGDQMTTENIGRRISDIGKAANVVVDPRSGKCASAHDLRAACLTRIAAQTTMSRTQALARHSDPKTTSQFYVRHKAEELAEAMGW